MEVNIPDPSHVKVTFTQRAQDAVTEWRIQQKKNPFGAERPNLVIAAIHPAYDFDEQIVEMILDTGV